MRRPSFEEKFRKSKAESIIEPLFRAARLTNELSLRRLNARARTSTPIRASHTALLPHLDLSGTRLTDLAERLGVSKQAVAPLVDELEHMGVLEKVPDPSDGRAKLIVYTERGKRGLLEGLEVLKEVECDLEQVIGRRRMRQLSAILAALLEHLEGDQDCQPDE